MRKAHILQPNHSLESPWEVIWYDTETNQEQEGINQVSHSLRFGWAAYRRRLRGTAWSIADWLRFETASQFWDWVEGCLHGRGRLYLFAHNAGFDLPVLGAFDILPRRGWKLVKAVIDCPPVILRWRKGHQTLECLDTLNIWRMPLAAIGQQIGLPKLDMPHSSASAEDWDRYGKRDTEIIMAACLKWWAFLRHNKLGGFAPTLAGQAMRAYRHRFMDVPLLVHDNAQALELERAAYLGGKVECYRIGLVAGPIRRLDVNSMYPSVMLSNSYPARLIGYTDRATVDDLEHWTEDRCVIADVELDTPLPHYPVVHCGKLLFPINKFRTSLCTPELRHALRHRRVLRVHRAACYEPAAIFQSFVECFWALRRTAQLKGDGVADWLAKIIQNSLYGKTGQRGRVYQEAGEYPTQEARAWLEIDADTLKVYKHRVLGGLHQIYSEEGESRDSMPAIAAHVTSHARLRLLELQQLAGAGNFYYSDTDCLDVNQAGYDRLAHLIDPDTLGALKLEFTADWAEYRGPKDYTYPTHWKVKGVRKKAHWIDSDTVVQEQWSTLVGLLRLGDLSAPTTRLISKHLNRRYAKGLVTTSGWVLPYSLG